MAGMYRVV